jgi:hypothetical protein
MISLTLRRLLAITVLALFLGTPRPTGAYSVLTHEQLIDLAWNPSIVPVLLRRYPGLTPGQLEQAHSFAYGGCAIQDLGYYPFGHVFFSELAHYVRSGDFVERLLANARTPDELAFAIGAISHYVGDSIGHAVATNPSEAEEFPNLRKRFGPSIAYDDDPHAHVRTEFAFDIDQLSKHRLAPSAYLRRIGLSVSEDLLERSFYDTYGLPLQSIEGSRHSTAHTYHFAVRTLLPHIAYAENVLHRSRMPPDVDTAEFKQLEALLAEADFEKGWDAYRKKAGIGTYTLAGLIFVAPKVGVLSELAIRGPDAGSEQRYVVSLVASAHFYRATLDAIDDKTGRRNPVPNRDLDTGAPVRPGAYRLTDETYAELLHRLAADPTRLIPAGLKQDIEAYYADPNAPISTKQNPKKWAEVQADLKTLEAMPVRQEL